MRHWVGRSTCWPYATSASCRSTSRSYGRTDRRPCAPKKRAAPYLVAPLLTGQLDTFAGAPEGFRRLRELVLNLAVRGMLVPQDAKDEPAENAAQGCRPGQVFEQIPRDAIDLGWAFVRLLGNLPIFALARRPRRRRFKRTGQPVAPFPWVTISDMDD
jgi:hypothetical protein